MSTLNEIKVLRLSSLLILTALKAVSAQTVQTAVANGPCGVAVNAAAGAAVIVNNNCDAKNLEIIIKLIDKQFENDEIIKKQQEEISKLISSVSFLAMRAGVGIKAEEEKNNSFLVSLRKVANLSLNKQTEFFNRYRQQDVVMEFQIREMNSALQTINKNAMQSDAAKEAARALEGGDPRPAITYLGAIADSNRKNNLNENKKLAAIYRQQAVLLRTLNIEDAVLIGRLALHLDPDNFFFMLLVGDWLLHKGEQVAALKVFNKIENSPTVMLLSDIKTYEWQKNLIITYDYIGSIKAKQGDNAGALKYFQTALLTHQELIRVAPGNAVSQLMLANIYGKIGDISYKEKNFLMARENYTRGLAIHETLSINYIDNISFGQNRALLMEKIGYMATYNDSIGSQYYKNALHIYQKIAKNNPDNINLLVNFETAKFRIAIKDVNFPEWDRWPTTYRSAGELRNLEGLTRFGVKYGRVLKAIKGIHR